jgi:hypothetical protein
LGLGWNRPKLTEAARFRCRSAILLLPFLVTSLYPGRSDAVLWHHRVIISRSAFPFATVAETSVHVLYSNDCQLLQERAFICNVRVSCTVTPCATVRGGKLVIFHMVKKYSAFYGTRRFIILSYSQESATGPYVEPVESSPCPRIIYLKIHVTCFSDYIRGLKW